MNPVRHAEHLGQLRRDHQNPDSLRRQFIHDAVDLALRAHIDTARRLIQNQQFQRRFQPFADDDFLLIAARQVSYLLLDRRRPNPQTIDA